MVGLGEVITLVLLGGTLLVHLLFVLGLFFWGRWVARRLGTRGWRRAAWLPLAALGLEGMAFAVFVVLVVSGFLDVGHLQDPSAKTSALSLHISTASGWASFVGVPAAALYVASVVTFSVGSFRRPRQERPPSSGSG